MKNATLNYFGCTTPIAKFTGFWQLTLPKANAIFMIERKPTKKSVTIKEAIKTSETREREVEEHTCHKSTYKDKGNAKEEPKATPHYAQASTSTNTQTHNSLRQNQHLKPSHKKQSSNIYLRQNKLYRLKYPFSKHTNMFVQRKRSRTT